MDLLRGDRYIFLTALTALRHGPSCPSQSPQINVSTEDRAPVMPTFLNHIVETDDGSS